MGVKLGGGGGLRWRCVGGRCWGGGRYVVGGGVCGCSLDN